MESSGPINPFTAFQWRSSQPGEPISALPTRASKRLRSQTTSSLLVGSTSSQGQQQPKGSSSRRRRVDELAVTAGVSADVAMPPGPGAGDVEAESEPGTLPRNNNKKDGDEFRILPQSYFNEDALVLAPRLLGKYLRHGDVVLRITEVEAYRPGDTACHGRFNTPRTRPMFGPAGHAYVYRCRFHNLVNVVADAEGVGAAVLIRAAEPVRGLEIIQERRGMATDKSTLLDGPGKVGQALAVTPEWSNHCLYAPGGLEVLDAPPVTSMLAGPRVGIDYASPEDVAAPWRFAVADTKWISNPRKTLVPL